MILNWFFSRTVRHALQMRKHVGKILCAQRDLLAPTAISAVETAMQGLRASCAGGDPAAIQAGMDELEKVANKWLKSYPNAGLRENVEVFLVAIAVAMGIRTFFLQPFKIPTGSMQPTLWGITQEQLAADFKLPNPVSRFVDFWINGVSYVHLVTKQDGQVAEIKEPLRLVLFNLFQKFRVGTEWYSVWFPPENFLERAGLASQGDVPIPRNFKAGEDMIKMRVVSGDHLFVDRLSYNFRRPKRGDIIVFETKNVIHPYVPRDQFYIKRLVGLGGEKLKIGSDQHLVVNGTPLTAAVPPFENLYSFDPKTEPPPNHYWGHTAIGLFADGREYEVPPNHYVVMGDNTRNSLDSRYWGAYPRGDAVGKAFFVYWPISSRFGWGYR